MEMPTIEMSNLNTGNANVQNNREEYDDTVLDNDQPLDEADYEMPVAPVLFGPPFSSAQGETYQEILYVLLYFKTVATIIMIFHIINT